MGTGKPEKAGACWRGSTKDKGFAEKSAPTKTPADWKNPGRVGAVQRRIKALRGGRRQHGRRQTWETRTMLAWPDEVIRPCGEQGANMGAGKPEKAGACWRKPTKSKKKNTEQLNHCSVEVTFFLHQHHLTKNYPDITSTDGSSPSGSPQTPSSPGSSTYSSGESAGSTSASPAFPYR